VKKKIVDIARDLNLSPSTISKIVNNKGRISSETRERVLKYVKECGYLAMPNARILSSKKVGYNFGSTPCTVTYIYGNETIYAQNFSVTAPIAS